MKTFPLQSLTLAQAQQKQFALVDTLCRHFLALTFWPVAIWGWPRG